MGEVTRHWCRVCGHLVRRVPDSYRWVHVEPGRDHGPIPTSKRPEVAA